MFDDLRSWPRNFLNATASSGNGQSIYRISNLSAGGALISGGEEMAIDSQCCLVLNLPDLQPIKVIGRIVRTLLDAHGHKSYGVAFHGLDADTEDLIHNFVLSQLEQQYRKAPLVLVVDDSVNTRRALERDLRSLGVSTLLAAMPLDAVRLLCNQEIHVDLAMVDLSLGPADGLHLLKHMEETYPNIRRVLISGRQRTCQLELAVAFGHAHAILPKPWNREQLSEVISRLITVWKAA